MTALIVYKKSTWELKRDSIEPDVIEFMNDNPDEVEVWKESHRVQRRCIESVISTVMLITDFKCIYRAYLQPINNADFVIAVGGDGTMLEVSHYINDDTPVLGINSDAERSVGKLCAATEETSEEAIRDFLRQKANIRTYNRIKVSRNGYEIPMMALNEVLVAHSNPAATSRYSVDGDRFKSSGHLLATAAGQTAFMYQAGGESMPEDSDLIEGRPLSVRNAKSEFYEFPVRVVSHMRDGKFWIDGEHVEYDLPMGAELVCEKGTPLRLVK
jgi:NAD+ kinase